MSAPNCPSLTHVHLSFFVFAYVIITGQTLYNETASFKVSSIIANFIKKKGVFVLSGGVFVEWGVKLKVAFED